MPSRKPDPTLTKKSTPTKPKNAGKEHASGARALVWPLIADDGLVAWIVMLMKVIVSSCATAASEFRRNPARMPYSADPSYLKIINDQKGVKNASTNADFGATIIGLI